MRVALVQVASPDDEPIDERRERVTEVARAVGDCDLIVLPELWDVGYAAFDRYQGSAVPAPGPTVEALGKVARELQCHVHVGSMLELSDSGACRNTAMMLDPSGQVVLSYSKIHVFGYESLEASLLEPGDSVSTVETSLGTIGTTTCYDLRFPELWRSLVDLGSQIVVVPAAWPAARREHWRLFTSTRAVEQQVVVIACNAVGTHGGVTFAGHSRVVDPWGEVLIEAGDGEGVFVCDIDVNVVDATRHEFPVLKDRLSDYGRLEHRERSSI